MSARSSQPSALPTDPAQHSPASIPSTDAVEWEREVRLRQYQLEGLSRQARRVPVPVILAAAVVGYLAWDPVPAWLASLWVLLVTLAVYLRSQYSKRPIVTGSQNIQNRLNAMVYLSMFNGSVAGLGSAYFFSQLPTDRQTLLTMIVIGWTAGAVSANAAYARAFFAYTLALLLPLAVAWAMQGPQGLGIAALAILFLAIESSFVRDNERVFRQSFSIRYENELLIQRLEQQQQETVREKERAETANLAKSRFLAAASHDIRQPLHTIGLYSAALSLRKTDERSKELARQISVAVASLGSLLDGLLDISKLDAAAVQPEKSLFEFSALANRIVEEMLPVAQAKGLMLVAEVSQGLYVHTDGHLLERILRNLIDNAVKYTRQGNVTLRALRREQRVVVQVIDTGIGIPANEQQRIYEEFYQLSNQERDRAQGLGLGLAIVQRLARLLDITLSLESTPGTGSTFGLSMPAMPAPSPAPESDTNAKTLETEPLQGLRVLVVEDESSIREGMRALLEGWGFQPQLAWDQASSLAAATATLPDLIIADYRLREAQTGLDVIRALRKNHGDIPAMVVSGDTAPERLQEIQSENILLLHKPVAEAALRQAIEETVQSHAIHAKPPSTSHTQGSRADGITNLTPLPN